MSCRVERNPRARKRSDPRHGAACQRAALRPTWSASAKHGSLVQMLRDPKVYVLSLVYFLLLGATYTMVFWAPT